MYSRRSDLRSSSWYFCLGLTFAILLGALPTVAVPTLAIPPRGTSVVVDPARIQASLSAVEYANDPVAQVRLTAYGSR